MYRKQLLHRAHLTAFALVLTILLVADLRIGSHLDPNASIVYFFVLLIQVGIMGIWAYVIWKIRHPSKAVLLRAEVAEAAGYETRNSLHKLQETSSVSERAAADHGSAQPTLELRRKRLITLRHRMDQAIAEAELLLREIPLDDTKDREAVAALAELRAAQERVERLLDSESHGGE